MTGQKSALKLPIVFKLKNVIKYPNSQCFTYSLHINQKIKQPINEQFSRGFRVLPQCEWDLRSSGKLRSVDVVPKRR
jgi:hypothetical protein